MVRYFKNLYILVCHWHVNNICGFTLFYWGDTVKYILLNYIKTLVSIEAFSGALFSHYMWHKHATPWKTWKQLLDASGIKYETLKMFDTWYITMSYMVLTRILWWDFLNISHTIPWINLRYCFLELLQKRQ